MPFTKRDGNTINSGPRGPVPGIEGDALVCRDHTANSEANGTLPSFSMPAFANGPDVIMNRSSKGSDPAPARPGA